VARPELDLTQHINGWAIPVDTVRVVIEQTRAQARTIIIREREKARLSMSSQNVCHID
jgi:hypothetical protein